MFYMYMWQPRVEIEHYLLRIFIVLIGSECCSAEPFFRKGSLILKISIHVWQPRVESEHCSVAYFHRIIVFEALFR